MMKEYEGIENNAPGMCDTPNALQATVKTAILREQELELWSLTGEIINQIGVELEENQLKNVGVFRATNGNVTKRLKLQVLTRA